MIAPVSLKRFGDRTLAIEWNDGKQSAYDLRALRLACPCASCVNEWTGKRTLIPGSRKRAPHPVVFCWTLCAGSRME